MAANISEQPPEEGTPLPQAPDVGPEPPLSASQFQAGAAGIAEGIVGDQLIKQGINILKVGGEVALLIFLFTHTKEVVALWKKYVAPEIKEIGGSVISAVTDLITPLSDLMGDFSGVYVKEVTRHYQLEKEGGTKSTGTPAGNAAQFAFDNIVAPIAFFTSGSSPDKDGAGARNIQQTLGVIVQLHLITWVVNIISNLTGIGMLHFINSFTEVLTAALSARSLSRMCMKPYLTTFISEPATKELNKSYPMKSPSAAAAVKTYLREGMSRDELIERMKGLGYNEVVTAQLLLDTARMMNVQDVADMVRAEAWTQKEAVTYLKQLGYDDQSANIVLFRTLNQLVDENKRRQADALGKHLRTGELDDAGLLAILKFLGFTQEEAQSYVHLYQVESDFPKLLSYTQVKALFGEGLVDLGYVTKFLYAQGYWEEDVNLLILLDFTEKDQRDARRRVLGATARLGAEEAKLRAAAARAKQDKDLAAAFDKVAAAKAALAAKYGQ